MPYVRTENGLEKLEHDDPYFDPPAKTWQDIRDERDSKLVLSDHTQYNNAPFTAQQITDWATYRQDLRDVPQDWDDPTDDTWPDEPT